MMSRARLVLVGGSGDEWSLDKDEFLIGRDISADLQHDAIPLSRFHARVMKGKIQYMLQDLGSRNGTFVNGRRVADDPVPLASGDEIVLAGVLAVQFVDPMETPPGPTIGRIRGIWIDPVNDSVWVDAIPVEPQLSPAQLNLLRLLLEHSGKPVSRDQIIASVWPTADADGVSEEAVRALIKRLRARLQQAAPSQKYLEMVRGFGLRYRHPSS